MTVMTLTILAFCGKSSLTILENAERRFCQCKIRRITMLDKYLAELDEIRNKYKYDDRELSAYLTGYLEGRKDEAKSLQEVINRATEIWYEGGIDG